MDLLFQVTALRQHIEHNPQGIKTLEHILVDRSTYADIELKIVWTSEQARHTECHYHQTINFWRDFFPGTLGSKLINAPHGEWVKQSMWADDLIPGYSDSNIVTLSKSAIQPIGKAGVRITPQRGRFYPRRIITGSVGVTAEEFLPLRILGVNDKDFTVDLNHPLAKHKIGISLRVDGKPYVGKEERGGRCNDVVYETLISGIGIQKPLPEGTDFYQEKGFCRIDESDDEIFYRQDRLINHIDSECSRRISQIYAQHIESDMKVLDLMSSYESHLPDVDNLDVTGLGMNVNEMGANPRISRYVIHNLNKQTILPFESDQFDVMLCSLSIEYLIQPLEVMREIVRVIRPGGRILVSFSDRWFPPKAIMIWRELHPFERLGMVLDYFLRTEGIKELETETVEGLLRPEDDKYANRMLYSDPVFIVSAVVN